jgi:hypothetical protein
MKQKGRCAQTKIRPWKPVTVDEISILLGVILCVGGC